MSDQLGQITWHTIHDIEVTRSDIIDRLKKAGISTAFAPKPILASDAFRRATSEMETRRLPIEDGIFMNLIVREVRTDAQEIVRRLVRETVDAKNRRLRFEQIAILKLDRRSGSFVINDLLSHTQEEQKAIQNATDKFHRYRADYQGAHIRRIVAAILRTLDHINLRPSGGVYFVPATHADDLQNLAAFVKSVGAEMWTMPMLDRGDTRAVIAHSLDIQVQETAQRLVKHLADQLARKGEVTDAEQRRAIDEFKRLNMLTVKYRNLLEDRLSSSQHYLDTAMKQVTSLLDVS